MNVPNFFIFLKLTSIMIQHNIEHPGDNVVHKKPRQMKSHWQKQLKSMVLVYFKVLYRIRYKNIHAILVQRPYNPFIVSTINGRCILVLMHILWRVTSKPSPNHILARFRYFAFISVVHLTPRVVHYGWRFCSKVCQRKLDSVSQTLKMHYLNQCHG